MPDDGQRSDAGIPEPGAGDPTAQRIMPRILGLGWHYRWWFIASFAISALSAAVFGFLLIAIDRMVRAWSTVQAAIDDTGSAGPEVLARANELMGDTAWHLLALAPIVGVSAYLAFLTGQHLANACIRDLRLAFVGHLVELDLGFHSRVAKGDLLTRMMADLNGVRSMVQRLYSRVMQRPLELIAYVVYVFYLDWRLGLLLAACLIPLTAVLWSIVSRMKRRSKRARIALADNLIAYEQITSGIRVIKAMGSSERERERFDRTNRTVFERRMKVARSKGQSEAITNASVFLILALLLWVGNQLFGQGLTEPATVIAVIAALGRITVVLRELQHAIGDLVENHPSAERVFAILDQRPAIPDEPGAPDCPVPRRAIHLDAVHFRYGLDQDEVLRGIDLEIPVGATLALVGPSGGGKSTLLDLVPRLHDPTAGAIRWDGVDVRAYRQRTVVHHCAVVQQDPFLFDDTVFENIRYGRPDASRAEVEEAARRAHVHEDILRLEGGLGYETPVGDRGSRLSGGQRQRVSIARALLRDAPVLLLDEPTSALDAESETHVQAALRELMRGRTTIMIAHRLATVRHADRICVVAGKDDPEARGRIIESGSHEELVALGRVYAGLVARQDLSG